MRAGAQYFLDHKDRSELRTSVVPSKQKEQQAAERAHASSRGERPDAKANETPLIASRIGHFAHQEPHFHSLASFAELLFPSNPPTPLVRPASVSALFGSWGVEGGGLSTEAGRPFRAR